MKRILISSIGLAVFYTLLSASTAAAQDVIHTRDGKMIESKVLEISEESVSYKMFNNLEGPVFKMASD